jgi:folate-binding protein YgfZ
MPLDVRKGFAFPIGVVFLVEAVPRPSRRSLEEMKIGSNGKPKAFRTSGGEAALMSMMNHALSTDYSAVRDGGAGVIDLSSRGRLLISGSEAVMFLNGLITNDMKTLALNEWMPAVFPNVQGRLLAAVRILHRHDGFLIDTERTTLETVSQLLSRFTLAGDFHVTELTKETAMLSLQGKNSAAVLHQVFGDMTTDAERRKIFTTKLKDDGNLNIIRATHTAEDGFDLFIDARESQAVRDSLVNAGAQTLGPATLDVLRIEAGIPLYGIDMDETNVVTETNLDDAVNFTKGCYIGQEIIARIKYRGHVAKKLAGVILEGDASVENGAKILSPDDKEIGRVTSFTFSPQLERTIALAYVKYDYLQPGTSVRIVAAGSQEVAATVAELPFVRGSWYPDLAP